MSNNQFSLIFSFCRHIENNCVIHIRASDGLFSTIAQLNILTVNMTTNSVFRFQKQQYKYSTIENSTKVAILGVLNVVGTFIHEHIEFSIVSPTEYFNIGKTSGAIKTTGKLFDRETQDLYKIIVEARSVQHLDTSRRSYTSVEIEILDENDNCPMFVNLPYYTTISVDDEKNELIFKVKAIDLDAGENAEVRYEMKKGNGELFRIDRKTGEIFLKKNINDHNNTFEIVISAYDGAVSPCSTDAPVHIQVI